MGGAAVGPVEVAPDVFWVQGALVSWYLLRDGQDLTLIDGGYPRGVKDLLSELVRRTATRFKSRVTCRGAVPTRADLVRCWAAFPCVSPGRGG